MNISIIQAIEQDTEKPKTQAELAAYQRNSNKLYITHEQEKYKIQKS